jgi:beta-galactosidase
LNQFSISEGVSLDFDPYHVGYADNSAQWWMELLTPTTATSLAQYHHPAWGKYSAITRNIYGNGEVTYVGFMPSDTLAEKIMEEAVKRADLWGPPQALHFPTIMRSGILANGNAVHYVLNYSASPTQVSYAFRTGNDLLSGKKVQHGAALALQPWGVAVIEEGAQ